MKVGVVFPQTEVGSTVESIRTCLLGIDAIGYDHLVAYEHILGTDPAAHDGWRGLYDITSPFHEPFVLFAFAAGITKLEVATDVVVLPQRQTALVAKQAALLDILTSGR